MSRPRLSNSLWMATATLLLLIACSSSDVKPVDIFPEDMCARCRMAVSDERFASEIISRQGEVFKFDDIGCMLMFRAKRTEVIPAAIFLKDYDTRDWIPFDGAVIIESDVETPMGSGKVAFGDSLRARAFVQRHPPPKELSAAATSCCSGTEQ